MGQFNNHRTYAVASNESFGLKLKPIEIGCFRVLGVAELGDEICKGNPPWLPKIVQG